MMLMIHCSTFVFQKKKLHKAIYVMFKLLTRTQHLGLESKPLSSKELTLMVLQWLLDIDSEDMEEEISFTWQDADILDSFARPILG